MKECYVGLDIGGTKIIAASSDKSGKIIKQTKSLTPVKLDDGLKLLESMINRVSTGKIKSIGCACGGPMDRKNGIVSPVNMPQWKNVNVKEFIGKKFSCDFFIDVDTNVAALGEHKFGKASKYRRFVYITLSTGMGGAFLIDGKIYRGKDDSHPELGHQSVKHSLNHAIAEPFCNCGVSDCLEGLVSGTAIKRLYGMPPEKITDKKIIEEIGFNLGQGLRNVVNFHAPDAIFIGGGVACGFGETLLEPARSIVEKHIKIVPKPVIALSSLGYDSALLGSIALAIDGGD
jgi:predicted NBD/HSP70 family sugar kinase